MRRPFTVSVVIACLAAAMLFARSGGAQAPPEQAARQACTELQSQLGSRFAGVFGSYDGCVTRVTAIVVAAEKSCAAAADPASCISTKMQRDIAALVSASTGGGGGGGGSGSLPTAAGLAEQMTGRACDEVRAALGAERFAETLVSVPACKAKIAAKATSLATAALAKCKDAANPTACLNAAVASDATQLEATLTSSTIPTAAQLGHTIATRACEGAKQRLGAAQFSRQFGTMDSCTARIASDAAALATKALAACPGTAGKAECIKQELETAATALQFSLGAGARPTAASLAAQVAGEACLSLKRRLGSQFSTRFASLAACEARARALAMPIAAEALARCVGSADEEACVRQRIELGGASLHYALGEGDAGPNAATLTLQVANQACTDAYLAIRSPRFEKLLGSLSACATRIKPAASSLVTASLAACKDAYHKEQCIRQELETGAVSLRLQLAGGGPSADDVADEVAGDACNAAEQQLGAGFAKRFGSFAGCKAKVHAAALAQATKALTQCRSASVPAMCLRTAIESAGSAIAAALGIKG